MDSSEIYGTLKKFTDNLQAETVLNKFIRELKFNPNHVQAGEHGGEFTSGGDTEETAAVNMEKYNPTAEQAYAVDRYTAGDFVVNKSLRTDKALTNKQQVMVNNLDSFLDNAPKVKMDTYRTLTLSEKDYKGLKEKAAVGNILKDKGYISTTLDKARAQETGNIEINLGKATTVLIKINGKNGVYLSKFSPMTHEKEVLFGRNTNLKVIKVSERVVENDIGKKIKLLNLTLEEL